MASYIDNIKANAAIAIPEAYTPDWAFLGKAQSQLTDMQRRGFEDFNNKYSLILNSQLSREDNIALREQFKNQADATISRISGTDLTDPRNLSSAKGIFKPLVQNRLYQKDIAVTRGLMNEYQKGQGLMTAADPNVRSAYNPYSLKEIQYALEDFKSLDGESALTFSPPQYIQNVDMEALAQKFYDERGWERKEIAVQGSGSRQYIVTDTNGAVIEEDVYRYLQSRFSNDPLVQQNIALKSRIDRRDYVESNLDQYGGDRNAATAAYVTERYNALSEDARTALAEQDNYLKSLEYSKEEIERDLKVNGTPTNTAQQTTYEQIMSKYSTAQQQQAAVTSPDELTLSNQPTEQELLDAVNILDRLEYNTGIATISRSLAYSKASREIKADPFAKVQFEKDLALRNSIALAQEKARLELIKQQAQGLGVNGPMSDVPVELSSDLASKEIGEEGRANMDYNQKAIKESTVEMTEQGAKVIADWGRLTGTAILDENGNPISDDRIAMLPPSLFNEYIEKARAVVSTGSRIKENPEESIALSAELKVYDQSFNINEKLIGTEQNHILEALDRYSATTEGESQDILMLKDIVNDGYIDYASIRDEFIKRSEADGSETFMARWNEPRGVANLNLFSRAYATTLSYFSDEAEDRFAGIFGSDWELSSPSTWGNESGTVGDIYYKNANDLRGLQQGVTTGVGGLSRIGTNLGSASNKGSQVNQLVNVAGRAVVSGTGAAAFGDIEEYRTGEVTSNDIANRVVRDVISALNNPGTKQSGARQMNVTLYRDPATGKQYMNILPDTKTLGELIGNKSTKGYAREYKDELQTKGVTILLEESAAIPESMYSELRSPVNTYMNLNNGAYTVGGDNPLDGGKIVITKNLSGGYNYSGYQYIYDINTGDYIKQPISQQILNTLSSSTEPIDNVVAGIQQSFQTTALDNIELQRQ